MLRPFPHSWKIEVVDSIISFSHRIFPSVAACGPGHFRKQGLRLGAGMKGDIGNGRGWGDDVPAAADVGDGTMPLGAGIGQLLEISLESAPPGMATTAGDPAVRKEGPNFGVVTHHDMVKGTTDSIALEQACNSPAPNVRADVSIPGCTLYHLLAGHTPLSRGDGGGERLQDGGGSAAEGCGDAQGRGGRTRPAPQREGPMADLLRSPIQGTIWFSKQPEAHTAPIRFSPSSPCPSQLSRIPPRLGLTPVLTPHVPRCIVPRLSTRGAIRGDLKEGDHVQVARSRGRGDRGGRGAGRSGPDL